MGIRYSYEGQRGRKKKRGPESSKKGPQANNLTTFPLANLPKAGFNPMKQDHFENPFPERAHIDGGDTSHGDDENTVTFWGYKWWKQIEAVDAVSILDIGSGPNKNGE